VKNLKVPSVKGLLLKRVFMVLQRCEDMYLEKTVVLQIVLKKIKEFLENGDAENHLE
jgi:hypothetical protein